MMERIVAWTTPDMFAFAYQAVGYLMLAAGLAAMAMFPAIKFRKGSNSRAFAVMFCGLSSAIIGIGLIFKVFGTLFGEWLLLIGDLFLPMGLALLVFSKRKSTEHGERPDEQH